MGKNMKNPSERNENDFKEEYKVENPKLMNGYSKLHKLDNNEYVSRSFHQLNLTIFTM